MLPLLAYTYLQNDGQAHTCTHCLLTSSSIIPSLRHIVFELQSRLVMSATTSYCVLFVCSKFTVSFSQNTLSSFIQLGTAFSGISCVSLTMLPPSGFDHASSHYHSVLYLLPQLHSHAQSRLIFLLKVVSAADHEYLHISIQSTETLLH